MEKQVVKVQHYFRRIDELSIKTLDELQQVRDFQLNNVKFELDKLTGYAKDHDEKINRNI